MKYFLISTMKYVGISLAVILLIVVVFFKGWSDGAANHDAVFELFSPCSDLSIRLAPNPDARFSHCNDMDWDGSTFLRDRLAEIKSHRVEYGIVCQDAQTQNLQPSPPPEIQDQLPKILQAHR